MPRITSGEFGGRTLKYPHGKSFRPTMDKVKEALFSILGDGIQEANVLDLFSAAGGLGLEALSRGANHTTFVEKNLLACQMLEANIKALDLCSRTEVIRANVLTYLRQSRVLATHVFCDPPYRSDLISVVLPLLAGNSYLSDKVVIAIEHPRDLNFNLPSSLKLKKRREYGETALTFLQKTKRSPM